MSEKSFEDEIKEEAAKRYPLILIQNPSPSIDMINISILNERIAFAAGIKWLQGEIKETMSHFSLDYEKRIIKK